ncbi:MAG TPA: ABC transporter ATP-binding protein [Microthrixaceae bacterium]|nr:ABC transporter ATP-binding protein [Microthrixaceae bacterium]
MSGVTFDGVTKRFGEVVAVDALDLIIAEREFMVLLGPSGCGKTTALRMVAGLESITAGTLSIGDRVVNDVAAQNRDIAMVFQSYALYPHMSVRKNIESPLIARRGQRPSSTERNQRVLEAATTLGLEELLDRKPGALSGGQRQRVALARAIVRHPEVFLMDEPLSNLDAKLRTQTRLELVELWRRLETTFVYVTHDQVEAMTMASRIAVLREGRLQQVGVPQDVYDRPANLFVAGFIGSPPMNTIAGVGNADADSPGLTTAAGVVPIARPGERGARGSAVAGVRPEHVSIGGDDLRGEVLNVELLGHERHVVCQVGDARWTVRQDGHDPVPTVGSAIGLGLDADQVHLFDPDTTERLN